MPRFQPRRRLPLRLRRIRWRCVNCDADGTWRQMRHRCRDRLGHYWISEAGR